MKKLEHRKKESDYEYSRKNEKSAWRGAEWGAT